jgi:phosphoglycerate dehydrogenase-like enzyme
VEGVTSDSAALVVSVPTEALAHDLQPLPDGVDLVVWDMSGPAPRPHVDLVVPPYMGGGGDILQRLADTRTRLVQSQSIGYEGMAERLPSGQVLANAASVHETSTAELALALTLAAQRHLPEFVRSQEHGRWEPIFGASLADRRVLVVGFGGVGTAIAARLAPFEVEVTAVARTAREEDGIVVHAIEDLAGLLPDAEIVVLALPGGDETRHIIDDAALAALPDGALVVNVGRGPLVDTDALVDHVRRGRIRAALDVTDPEPLPDGHPLWSLPGVLIAPHVGGASSAMAPRIARLVRTQIERMLRGEAPLNVVLET